MKIVTLDNSMYGHFIRHWGRWYGLLNDGGLVYLKRSWFNEARNLKEKRDV